VAGGDKIDIFPGEHWYGASRCDPRVVDLYSRHYSSIRSNKNKGDWLRSGITAPGEQIVLLSSDSRALFVWLKQKYSADDQAGVNCAVFRNEGPFLSSMLIEEAEGIAWARWPGERLYTYVDPGEIKSKNPGCCFKKCGWKTVKVNGETYRSQRGLIVLEKMTFDT